MLYIVNHVKDPVSIHNIGAADTISVTRQAELICAAMGLDGVKFNYTGGAGGWPGDVPSFRMDVQKLGHAWLAGEAHLRTSRQNCDLRPFKSGE